ncbi:DUF6221 family protein [Streptosporangium roseum]|uniref:DUF6221 family protein n=1 Tax=Streptosporangium roseum TaxID=2001 RepID=UPI0012DCF948|nr:DUF6221 family protein [Streptosporangium roseum]
MDELIAFLRARWDKEEADARLASEVYGARWWWNPAFGLVKGDPDNGPEATSIFSVGEETVAEVWSEVGPHIARHDPARVLPTSRPSGGSSRRTPTSRAMGSTSPWRSKTVPRRQSSCSPCRTPATPRLPGCMEVVAESDSVSV